VRQYVPKKDVLNFEQMLRLPGMDLSPKLGAEQRIADEGK
jgi:hypothetical protein